MNTPFNKSFFGKSPINELTAKQEDNLPEALKTAIEAKSPNNYGSPLDQLSPTGKPGNVGYYNPEFEAHPSEKLPTRRENQAELDAAKFGLSQAKQIRKTRLTPKTAKQAYDLSKPYFDADSKMRKQKRKDYSDVLKAGATIAKSSALNQNKKKKKELPQAVKDSLQQKALKRGKPFYSKKHKVYVEGEDGVLSRTPVNTSNYEKL